MRGDHIPVTALRGDGPEDDDFPYLVIDSDGQVFAHGTLDFDNQDDPRDGI